MLHRGYLWSRASQEDTPNSWYTPHVHRQTKICCRAFAWSRCTKLIGLENGLPLLALYSPLAYSVSPFCNLYRRVLFYSPLVSQKVSCFPHQSLSFLSCILRIDIFRRPFPVLESINVCRSSYSFRNKKKHWSTPFCHVTWPFSFQILNPNYGKRNPVILFALVRKEDLD